MEGKPGRRLVKPGAKRRRGSDGGGGGDSESSGSDAGGEKKQRKLDEMLAELKRQRAQRHRDYYAVGNYSSYPASFIAFHIAKEVGRSRNDMLWLAIVGLTDVRAARRRAGAGSRQPAADAARAPRCAAPPRSRRLLRCPSPSLSLSLPPSPRPPPRRRTSPSA